MINNIIYRISSTSDDEQNAEETEIEIPRQKITGTKRRKANVNND